MPEGWVGWSHLASVQGQTRNKSGVRTTYELRRRKSDGHIGCSCQGYQFAKGTDKSCTHINEHLLAHPDDAVGASRRQQYSEFGSGISKSVQEALQKIAQDEMYKAAQRTPKSYATYMEYGARPNKMPPKASVAAKPKAEPAAPRRKRAITFGEDL
jgi:hypothetical protein